MNYNIKQCKNCKNKVKKTSSHNDCFEYLCPITGTRILLYNSGHTTKITDYEETMIVPPKCMDI